MRETFLNAGEVRLRAMVEGDGPLVLMVHGFPESWYSWRHQIGPLVDAGYRVLVPDQRGYGRSSQPTEVADYDIVHLTDDLLNHIHLENNVLFPQFEAKAQQAMGGGGCGGSGGCACS